MKELKDFSKDLLEQDFLKKNDFNKNINNLE